MPIYILIEFYRHIFDAQVELKCKYAHVNLLLVLAYNPFVYDPSHDTRVMFNLT